MKIGLRSYAHSIVELFENVLDEKDITISSVDDDQKEPDNCARLYGMEYATLEDAVAGVLQGFGKRILEETDPVLIDSYNDES